MSADRHARHRHAFRLYLSTALVATVSIITAHGVFETFDIASRSMVPTLHVGDRVLGTSVAVFRSTIERRDLVTFDPPDGVPSPIPLVKRVVALPGDEVWVTRGALFVNGIMQVEPYTAEGVMRYSLAPYRVPAGRVFVLGDNRNFSEDSTVFGPIELDHVRHRVWLRYQPWARRCSFRAWTPGFPRC